MIKEVASRKIKFLVILIGIILVSGITILFVNYFDSEKLGESKEEKLDKSVVNQVVKVMESYFEDMNTYGIDNPEKIADKYFTTAFEETIDFEGMKSSFKEIATELNIKVADLEVVSETTQVKYSDVYDEYYVFVTESISSKKNKEITTPQSHGVYIINKEDNKYKIDYLEDEANLSDLGDGVYIKDNTIYIEE